MLRSQFALLILVSCAVAGSAAVPAGVTLPLVVWDTNFSQETVGQSPHPLSKAQIEARGEDPWKRPALPTYDSLEFVTRDRTAVVVKEALGLTDQPVLFTCPDNNQPHWGPRMGWGVPPEVAAQGKRWRLSFDASMGCVAQMGGMYLLSTRGRSIFDVGFFNAGSIKVNNATEVGTYQAGVPVHLDIVADADASTFVVTVNGKAENSVTVPWDRADGTNLGYAVFNGLLPGGRAWPGQLAYDNIKLVLEEAL